MDSSTKRRVIEDDDGDKSRQNPFAIISQDSVSEIISRTSPLDASRFALISKGFKSAADSDTAWNRFVPSEIVSRADSSVAYSSIKELYFSLCTSPILIDGGELSFFPEKKTGKKCFMVGARKLVITSGDDPQQWEWTSHPDSRFSEVAKLKAVNWIDIRGKIDTQMLSLKTNYGAYLVFKLAGRAYGLDSVDGIIRFVNRETDLDVEGKSILLHLHMGKPMYRSPAPRQPGQHAIKRDDGWKEVELGSFYNDHGDGGEVEARLMQTLCRHRKSGLIVQGIEFRPKTSPRYIDHWKLR